MYDHYISLDWAQKIMALARISNGSDTAQVSEQIANIRELKVYLEALKGTKILTFEETSTAHWLYTETVNLVDKVIVCDPYRNSLLKEGPKTDKIDAVKLVMLLKANLLKPVFHDDSNFYAMRKLVSGYDDVVARGVRLKNQRRALLIAFGNSSVAKNLQRGHAQFVLQELDKNIELYEEEKARYCERFLALTKQHTMLRQLKSIPGIGSIGAVKIGSIVVTGSRFPDRNHFLSYCGLVRHERMSGGRKYGHQQSRCNRTIKQVIKTAALTVTQSNRKSIFNDYYHTLCQQKGFPTHKARNAVARRIATTVYGVLKSRTRFCKEKIAPAG